jgi:hypothetical protein
VIPNLFDGNRGIILPQTPGEHQAHFLDATGYTENFLSLNTAIATQLTLLPIASPASGFTYSYDRAAGVSTRTANTFGPILTERGETIGQKKVFVGFTYQRFRFDEIDGQELGNLPAVFRHVPVGRALEDVITTVNNVDLRIDQFTIFGTFGVTNAFDISVAVPIMDVRLGATAAASIRRHALVNADCPANSSTPCHYFEIGNPTAVVANFQNESEATGLGDVTLRLKHGLYRGERVSVALLTDFRFPTGEERDFLGTGAMGFKPFVAVSFGAGRVSPHFNVGYQWNGDSVLAGDLVAGTEGSLPNQFFYAVGIDVGVTRRFTAVFDIIGQRLFDSPRIVPSNFAAAPNISYPQLATTTSDFNVSTGAVGFKLNLVDELLLTGNLLFRLDDSGLRQKLTPLIGLSYSF